MQGWFGYLAIWIGGTLPSFLYALHDLSIMRNSSCTESYLMRSGRLDISDASISFCMTPESRTHNNILGWEYRHFWIHLVDADLYHPHESLPFLSSASTAWDSATFSARRYAGSCDLNQSLSFLSGICRFFKKLRVFCEILPGGTDSQPASV